MSKIVIYGVFAKKRLVISWLKLLLCYPLFLISLVTPKSRIIVYGSMNGFCAADNAKYQYINSNHEKKIFILKHKPNIKTAQNQNINAIYCYSIKGLWCQLVARKAYWTHGINDFFAPLVAGTEVIGLQHGAPIKKGGTARERHLLKNNAITGGKKLKVTLKKLLVKLMPYSNNQYCDKTICGEKRFKPYVEAIFDFCKPEILEVMLPRVQFVRQVKKQNYILYAPTFRPYRGLVETLKSINFDPIFVDKVMKKNEGKLRIRPHPVDNDKFLKNFLSLDTSSNITIDETEDLYSNILNYSAIITDFSSIYQDARWLGIPVYVVCDDLETYDQRSGLFDWYKEEISKELFVDFKRVIKRAVVKIND